MWFSNLQVYRFNKEFLFSADEIEEKLSKKRFLPCGSLQPASFGFVPPLGRHGVQLVHEANGYLMITLKKEEKILPASVVRAIVSEKVAEIEESQARQVRRKERETIKDEVMLELLPKAFSRSNLTFAYMSIKQGLFVVNASSAKKAEEFMEHLRKALGTLPVIRPVLNNTPTVVMSHWLRSNELPDGVALENECELQDPNEDGGIVRCKRQDLQADEVQAHLQAGKQVTKLAISWAECLTCVISEDLSINRLRFSDEILEQAADMDSDDQAASFDQDFTIMTLELGRFIPQLFDMFGGEKPLATL